MGSAAIRSYQKMGLSELADLKLKELLFSELSPSQTIVGLHQALDNRPPVEGLSGITKLSANCLAQLDPPQIKPNSV